MNALIGKLILCFLLLTTTIYCFADDKETENYKYFKILLNAKTFSGGGTGEAGTPTEETIAFKHIFFSKNAHEEFKKILEKGSIAGKLYALSGLYFYDYREYKKTVEKYLNVDDVVTIFSGCMIAQLKIKELMKTKGENVVRLSNNQQTIYEWEKNNNVTDGCSVDFYGGGYPQLLKEYIISNDERIKSK
jgi:hypothetical protein